MGEETSVRNSEWTFAEVYCVLNTNGSSTGSALLGFDHHRQQFVDLGMHKGVVKSDLTPQPHPFDTWKSTADLDDFTPEALDKPFGQPTGPQMDDEDLPF
jgi:hypothetical protein